MCFKQKEAISTLKLVDQFTYLDNNISSTKSDINICLMKAWDAIERLLIIWKSNLSDKTGFLPNCSYIRTIIWIHHMDTDKMHWEKAR